MKPRGLNATVAAMSALNLGGFVGIDWTRPGIVVMVTLVILFGYVIIWNYWQGKNWARFWVLSISVLTQLSFLGIILLFILDRLTNPSIFYYWVVIANAALGAYLLYWLNRKDVRAWFSKSEPDTRVLL